MPRVALSAAEVAAAFEKILSQGDAPTAEKIHALLGKGTIPSIKKFLAQFREQSRAGLHAGTTAVTDLLTPLLHGTPQEVPPLTPQETPPPAPSSAPETPVEMPEPAVPPEVPTNTPPEQAHAFGADPSTPNQPAKRPFRRERTVNRQPQQNTHSNTNHAHNGSNPHLSQPQSNNRDTDIEENLETPLEQLSEAALIIKIRRLESYLMKEQMRRDVAERIMIETKDYAESIKEQVAQRINDVRQNMDEVIEQLKNQLQTQKQNFDHDLRYYQEHLSKANEKIASLLK